MAERKKSSLFRKEVNPLPENSFGKVLLILPYSFKFLCVVSLLIAAALLAFIYFASYTHRENVSGWLKPSQGLIYLYAQQAGTVNQVDVKNAQRVEQNQVLYKIFTGKASEGDLSLGQLQVHRIQQQIVLQKKKLATLANEEQRYEQLLAKGVIAKAELDRHQINRVEAELDLQRLEEQMTRISGQEYYTIRAPAAGTISALIAIKGDYVRDDAYPLAVMIPKGAVLEGVLFVPARAVGFVHLGQKVLLKYRAYPYQRFGFYQSRVKYIDQTLLKSTDINLPFSLKEPFYRVTVTLDSQYVRLYGKTHALQPGMLFDAVVLVEKRTLWQWILDPLYSLWGSVST